MSDELRYVQRIGMPPVPVHDALTEELVGNLADLSSEGMGMTTRLKLQAGALYQWRFVMGSGGGHSVTVECGVEIMRSVYDETARTSHVGARFILLPANIAEQINEWCDTAKKYAQG